MAGGLINIVSHAVNDLYLTGAPQITFYKLVYRRYTNFAMESVFLDFDDTIKFDYESELVVPRNGDLIHKTYLHISIPSISITKHEVGIDIPDVNIITEDNISSTINYKKILNTYANIMTNIYRIAFKASNATNVPYTGLIDDIRKYVNGKINISTIKKSNAQNRSVINNENNVLNILNDYDTMLTKTLSSINKPSDNEQYILTPRNSNLWSIILLHNDASLYKLSLEKDGNNNIYDVKKLLFEELTTGLDIFKSVQKYFFEKYKKSAKTLNDYKNPNIKSAWVKNLGHSIIEYIDVYIGGRRIDSHLGIWIDIWHQLTYKEIQNDIYDRLIGNIDALTNFDNKEKPAYDMYIPLSFWFNKFNGLSFPLIAMQYNDIRFNVKLRKFKEVYHIEKIYKANLNGQSTTLTADMIDFLRTDGNTDEHNEITDIEEIRDITLSDIWDNKGKMLAGHIVTDYIYLESQERKRFATSGHEYLIERIQYNTIDNVVKTSFDIELNTFTNPCKELIWVFSKDVYTDNNYGYTCCKWYDYSSTDNCKVNPVISAQIYLNNYVRVQKQSGNYFGIYQPMTYHNTSPSTGINSYSFCLDPMQHQPTGSCNFSKISSVRMFIEIDDMLFRYNDTYIYPYDNDIDFNIIITDQILGKIDINYAKTIIENSNTEMSYIHKDIIDIAIATIEIYNSLTNGDVIEIPLSIYRKIFMTTTAKFHVFNLSMNILRIIGGYGALAYSGPT